MGIGRLEAKKFCRQKEIGDCWLARDRKRGEEKPQTVIFSSVCDVGKKKEKGRGWTVAKKERMETPDGKWRELRNIACSKKWVCWPRNGELQAKGLLDFLVLFSHCLCELRLQGK